MNAISVFRRLTFVAFALFASQAYGQYGDYTMYYQSGPLSTLYASPSYIRIQVPIERAGHSFSVKYRTTPGGPVSTLSAYYTGLITNGPVSNGTAATINPMLLSLLVVANAPSPTYTYSGGTYTYTYFSAYEWWLTDTTAGQDSQVRSGNPGGYNGTTVTYSGVLSDTWTQASGLTNRYFTIPNSRYGHALVAGSTSLGWTTVSSGYKIGTFSNGTSGSQVPLNWFSGAGPVGTGDSYIGDRTDGMRAPVNQTDVRTATWEHDYTVYPMTAVNLYLPAAEVTNRYVLHWGLPNQPQASTTLFPLPLAEAFTTSTVNSGTQTIPAGAGTISVPIPHGASFWLTRNIDATASNTFVLTSSLATSSTPKVWWIPIAAANIAWTLKTFGIASSRIDQTFTVSQPSSISATTPNDPALRTILRIEDHTTQGWDNHFDYFTVTALVNPASNEPFTLIGSSGIPLTSTNDLWIRDGWSWIGGQAGPPPPSGTPGQYTFSLTVAGPRALHPFRLTAPNGFVFDSLFPTSYFSVGPVTLQDPWHGTSWTANGATYTFSKSYAGPIGDWRLNDTDTDDADVLLQVGNVANFARNIGYWALEAEPRDFQISGSRWTADTAPRLWLRQRDGWETPVTALSTAYWVSGDPTGSVWTSSGYLFNARSFVHPGVDYWVYDEETGDESELNTTNLIEWFALPTPAGPLTGVITPAGVAELQWPLDGPPASVDGAYEVQRKFLGESSWETISDPIPASTVDTGGFVHFTDESLVGGEICLYRVRYVYGNRRSAGSSPLTLDYWPDTDSDALPDWWELAVGLDPSQPNDIDSDGDGLNDLGEFQAGTDPTMIDSDGDGLTDGWEIAHGYNPLFDDAMEDLDSDGRSGLEEFTNDPDFDGDKDLLPDAWERLWAFNPMVADENNNGTEDGNDDADGDGRLNVWEYRDGFNPRAPDNPVSEGPLLNLRATKTADGGLDLDWELGPDPLPEIVLRVQNRVTGTWRPFVTLPPTATHFHATPDFFTEEER